MPADTIFELASFFSFSPFFNSTYSLHWQISFFYLQLHRPTAHASFKASQGRLGLGHIPFCPKYCFVIIFFIWLHCTYTLSVFKHFLPLYKPWECPLLNIWMPSFEYLNASSSYLHHEGNVFGCVFWLLMNCLIRQVYLL